MWLGLGLGLGLASTRVTLRLSSGQPARASPKMSWVVRTWFGFGFGFG